MPTVNGPLMSASASGSISQRLTFRSATRGHVCVAHSRPRNDQTPAQASIRAMVSFLTKLWKTLTPTNQATWNANATLSNTSAFNAFFRRNMQRWAIGQPPQIENLAIPTAAYTPTITLTPTKTGNRVTIAIAPTNATAHVTVTGTTSPDATGTYNYLGINQTQHAYRRTTSPYYRIFYNDDERYWFISTADNYTAPPAIGWATDTTVGPQGTYYVHFGGTTGTAQVSAESGGSSPTASAVAIYRNPTTITTPPRELCRAVLKLDANGQATWTDQGQIGLNNGRDHGLPAGTYHYMAIPLSLDGRAGQATADASITIP